MEQEPKGEQDPIAYLEQLFDRPDVVEHIGGIFSEIDQDSLAEVVEKAKNDGVEVAVGFLVTIALETGLDQEDIEQRLEAL